MIPSIKDWLDATAVFGRGRSADLAALDTAIRNFGLKRDAAGLKAVGDAWAAWKLKHSSAEKSFSTTSATVAACSKSSRRSSIRPG